MSSNTDARSAYGSSSANAASDHDTKATERHETPQRAGSLGIPLPKPQVSRKDPGSTRVIRSETGELCSEGDVRPMFARWLLQSFIDQPYSGIRHFNEATGPILVRQEVSMKKNISSLGNLSLVVETGGSCVQEKFSSPPETPVAHIYSHRDILAFCGSWQ
ncbi:hypothetical protein GQ44DRAFT_774380 [Phaeosphaeriaceae sp. PMI808]|nr:hypothetical protein GQ44DRAFT_774380 [Phaeosphaeriaceae sp. PMI808]